LLPVLCVEFWVLASDDVREVDAGLLVADADGGVGVDLDCRVPRMPAHVPPLPLSPNVFEGVCETPPVDVEAALDPDEVEVCVLVAEPVGVFADLGADARLVPEPLADEPDESEEAGWAQATPQFVKTAAPTPKATASPPIRPIYLAAFIGFLPGRQPAPQQRFQQRLPRSTGRILKFVNL
jgi:hypothetical protein